MNSLFNKKDALHQGVGYGQEMALILISIRARTPLGILLSERSLYCIRGIHPPFPLASQPYIIGQSTPLRVRRGRNMDEEQRS